MIIKFFIKNPLCKVEYSGNHRKAVSWKDNMAAISHFKVPRLAFISYFDV